MVWLLVDDFCVITVFFYITQAEVTGVEGHYMVDNRLLNHSAVCVSENRHKNHKFVDNRASKYNHSKMH